MGWIVSLNARVAVLGLLVLPLSNCGPDDEDVGFIEIINPTTDETYTTNLAGVVIGGNVSGTSSINWSNSGNGSTGRAYGPFYYDGHGTWFDDTIILEIGENVITFTTDHGASDTIRITRTP